MNANAADASSPRDAGKSAPVLASCDQALLDSLYRQSRRSPIPIIIVDFVIALLAYDRVHIAILVTWLLAAIAIQIYRYKRLRSLAYEFGRPPSSRLKEAAAISFLHSCHLASCVAMFPFMDDTGRALYSMILVGITANAIATSNGYKPIFLAFVVPLYTAMILGWLLVPGDILVWWQQGLIAFLIPMHAGLLYMHSRDAYESFEHAHRVNERLETALEEARQASEAKTRFLATASHDLRQPLHTLSLLSAAMTMRDLDPKSSEIAASMNRAMGDLSAELDGLLDISKLDAGVVQINEELIDLHPLLTRLVSLQDEIATSKGLKLALNAPLNAVVQSDRMLLERILRNLIDNAIKYTSAGKILVTLGQDTPGNCYVEVSDTGIGISAEQQNKIFEEFYQVGNHERDRRRGLGLGLSIVRRLTDLLNAKLSLESQPGVGTKFRIEMKAMSSLQRTQPKVNTVGPNAYDRLKNKKLLIVEDDTEVRNSTRLLFEGLGCHVYEAMDGVSAVQTYLRIEPDIVIADVRLPGDLTGLEVARQFRRANKDVAIIIVSGETSPQRLKELSLEEFQFLVKPAERGAIVGAVLNGLNKKNDESNYPLHQT